ncbi:Solute carrier family 12 member 9, partial [Ophiophagus hannah]
MWFVRFLLSAGGMKPNTLVLGFYDDSVPEDYFLQDPAFSQARENDEFGVDLAALQAHFPPVRVTANQRALKPSEYVAIISDAVKMHKNVCLARYFHLLDRDLLSSSVSKKRLEGRYIDVWPLNLLRPNTPTYVDICSLFLLQMACILTMVSSWKGARLRLFICVESGDGGWGSKEEKLRELLTKLRIKATIKIVTWDQVATFPAGTGGEVPGPPGPPARETRTGETFLNAATFRVTDEYLMSVNELLRKQGGQTAVRFLYLPRPPADTSQYERYLEQLEVLTTGLGPTLLIHGLTPVTCTELQRLLNPGYLRLLDQDCQTPPHGWNYCTTPLRRCGCDGGNHRDLQCIGPKKRIRRRCEAFGSGPLRDASDLKL